MQLSSRDRAKVQAALVAIHSANRDTGAVTRMAEAIIKTGSPAKIAYARAFDDFAQRNPDLAAGLHRIGQLIDATDDRTVANYNVHFSRYIETGDGTALSAVLPTIQQDLIEMAARTGDAGFAEGVEAPTGAGASPASEAPSGGPGWGPEGYRPSEAPPSSPAS